jgi:hypothetical protein
LAKCPFFNDKMANMPVMADMYKRNYCRGDATSCARYSVFRVLGSAGVPEDLFPNQQDQAERYLSSHPGSAN